ncbi:hypothetical protein M9458_035660, partial [Cirrhinus mrigala]
MAERMAARLSAQEEQIEVLSREIRFLQDGLTGGFDFSTLASGPNLDELRVENEKLQYRLLHLRRNLRAEQELEENNQKQRTNKPEEKQRANTQKNQNKHDEQKEKSRAK